MEAQWRNLLFLLVTTQRFSQRSPAFNLTELHPRYKVLPNLHQCGVSRAEPKAQFSHFGGLDMLFRVARISRTAASASPIEIE
jgi:hypothetical protein